jgi:DNA end-binding protein Ku
MRALWKGSISFGLVHIPVKMYTASREQNLKFVMLHKKDLSEIRYARMCKVENKEVPWEEIVKGYELSPGEFVVMDDNDFKKVNLDKSKSIEIIHFIKEEEIDTVYYAKPYFLEPEKNAGNAYGLLLEALKQSGKVGIAKFVLHNREHLAVIKPYEDVIVLNELRYHAELLKADDINIPKKEKASSQELTIALKLIDHLTAKFKPQEYVDTYIEEVEQMIKQKSKGKKIQPKGHEARPSKVHDLMSLLKASLDEESPKKTKRRKAS